MKLSIKSRVTLWYMAVIIVVTVTCVMIMQITSDQLKNLMIQGNLKSTATLVKFEIKELDHLSSIDSNLDTFKTDHVLIYDVDGHPLYGSAPDMIENMDLTDGEFHKLLYDDQKIIVYDTLQSINENDQVWIRSYVTFDSIFLVDKSIYTAGLLTVPIIILGAVIGGLFITRKIFNPIKVISETAREIAESGDMTKRIEVDPKQTDELTMLSKMFNSMFNKLSDSFESERQFTMDASHELRTPLTVILTQAEYLSRQFEEQDDADADATDWSVERKKVNTILNKAQYMSRLVNSLLFIARMENNDQVIDKESLNLSELVTIVIEEMDEAAAMKEILISANIEEDLWVNADQGMLFRVFINLLSNAIEYGKSGGSVKVSLVRSEGRIKCCIADNGIGIAEEHLPRIWQRFYQVNPARKRTENNMGLGLFMVKKIIDLHGGTISVDSQPGEGTRFTFTL